MGDSAEAKLDRELARARTSRYKLAVASRDLGIKIVGLSVCLAVLVAGVVLGALMLGGYVSPPAMSRVEIQQMGTIAMSLCGIGAGFVFYLLMAHWTAKSALVISLDRLRTAMEAAEAQG